MAVLTPAQISMVMLMPAQISMVTLVPAQISMVVLTPAQLSMVVHSFWQGPHLPSPGRPQHLGVSLGSI